MVDWRVKMHCDEIVISDVILQKVNLRSSSFQRECLYATNRNIKKIVCIPAGLGPIFFHSFYHNYHHCCYSEMQYPLK